MPTTNLSIPSKYGELNVYNLTGSRSSTPIIYFVNGIRVPGEDHAKTAALLSVLTEHPIRGVYNKTDGAIVDVKQCIRDYTQNAIARGLSFRLTPNKHIADDELVKKLDQLIGSSLIWNLATVALFRQLAINRSRMKYIVAHSQGNLLASNALFVLEDFLRSGALSNERVYSLASPSPGWPLGLRHTNGGGGRQDNAYMNGLVALLRPHNLAAKLRVAKIQNAGDFRTHQGGGVVGIAAHDTELNIAFNFLQSIRNDLGYTDLIDENFLNRARSTVAEYFPEVNK